MATKSSIHIKPCNIASSEAHNRRTAEYMRHIGESRIYVVPELSTDNEQWINPDYDTKNFITISYQTFIPRINREFSSANLIASSLFKKSILPASPTIPLAPISTALFIVSIPTAGISTLISC